MSGGPRRPGRSAGRRPSQGDAWSTAKPTSRKPPEVRDAQGGKRDDKSAAAKPAARHRKHATGMGAAGRRQDAPHARSTGLAARGASTRSAEPAAPQAMLPSTIEPQRVQKLLADAGVGSRREIERWIVEGRLSINGLPAVLGAKAVVSDRFALDGDPIRIRDRDEVERRVIAYHKPLGELTTRNDPDGRPTVFEKLPRLRGSRWIAIGRLDFNTSGLLLFTNDGALANLLMHPKQEIAREYAVRTSGVTRQAALDQLAKGVLLDDGPAKFESIADGGGEGVNHWYRVVLREGRNREVRRMFEAVGTTVSRLMRVRFGPILLDPWLKRGMTRELTPEEVASLEIAAGATPTQPPTPPPPPRPSPSRPALSAAPGRRVLLPSQRPVRRKKP